MDLFSEARRMVPSLSRDSVVVYVLRLQSGSLYVGCSENLEIRLGCHLGGTACRTTAIDPPVAIVFVELHADFISARRREAQIKRWSHAKKEALIGRDMAVLQRLSRSHD
jgi:tRNA/rRNA methyltransferase